MSETNLKSLSDDELLRRLSELMGQTRRAEADLVAHIGEVDERRLFAREASPSMFEYCRRVLGLRENEAYLRITVARAAREHPVLLSMLRDGRLHLSGIAKLARHLTLDNREAVLERAAGMSHRQIKELVAELEPKPDAPSRIRRLPAPSARRSAPTRLPLGTQPADSSPGDQQGDGMEHDPARASGAREQLGTHRVAGPPAPSTRPAPAPAAVLEPLSPARHRVQFTASTRLRDKLERLQALMRSSVPDGDLAQIIEVAVSEKLERLEAKRFGRTKAQRKSLRETRTTPTSRHIPAPVRRAVYQRDGGRCTYVNHQKRRCSARSGLEFHHDAPYGTGGDHSPTNVRLLCSVHNLLMAELDYGKEKMARYRRSNDRVSEQTAVYI